MASASSVESEDEDEEGGDAFGMRRVRVQHGPESVSATEYVLLPAARIATDDRFIHARLMVFAAD